MWVYCWMECPFCCDARVVLRRRVTSGTIKGSNGYLWAARRGLKIAGGAAAKLGQRPAHHETVSQGRTPDCAFVRGELLQALGGKLDAHFFLILANALDACAFLDGLNLPFAPQASER